MELVSQLKRSQFVIGVAKAVRGLIRDTRVLIWYLKRNSKIADYFSSHPIRKLQLGASNNLLDGWLNAEIFVNHAPLIYLDATKRFPFPNDTFDYIMAEHMIEHVEYQAAQLMLRECWRVLKPGGRVRFATPDLGVLLGLHSKEKTDAQRHYINWIIARLMPEVRECQDVFVINNAFHEWGHCFLYDRETLHHALYTSGFHDIKFYKPGDSEDPLLQNIECHGKEIDSEVVNQFETIVVEGQKTSSSN